MVLKRFKSALIKPKWAKSSSDIDFNKFNQRSGNDGTWRIIKWNLLFAFNEFYTCLNRYFRRLSTKFKPKEMDESANKVEVNLEKINN